MHILFSIAASLLMQPVAAISTGSFVARSDFNDGFGPIRADRFSVVLYSKYALNHDNSDSKTIQNEIFANISVVNGNFQQLYQCPDDNAALNRWMTLDDHNAGISFDSNIAIYPAGMCAQNPTQFPYDHTEISYGKDPEIFDVANNNACQLWSGIGGDPVTVQNATGPGIMRCVLDFIPRCERPGAGNC